MKTSNKIYPLLCNPVLKEKIWGGRKLEWMFGMNLPEGKKIGEAWLVADLREGNSSIGNGIYQNKSLSEVTSELGERLIGSVWKNTPGGGHFPLLIKFIDAQDDLSIQVHPDSESCRKYFPDDFSKDETWVVLDSRKNGKILHGFQPGTTPDVFDQQLAKDKIIDILRSVIVSAGDVIRVAPGTVHALCDGVVILEIQEPSDSTFRIFDYNRLGDDGKPRTLHIEQSRKVLKFGDTNPPKLCSTTTNTPWGTHELLVDVPAYRIERMEINSPFSWSINPLSVQVFILLEGEINMKSEGRTLPLKKGSCVILPAALENIQINSVNKPAVAVLAGGGGIPLVELN